MLEHILARARVVPKAGALDALDAAGASHVNRRTEGRDPMTRDAVAALSLWHNSTVRSFYSQLRAHAIRVLPTAARLQARVAAFSLLRVVEAHARPPAKTMPLLRAE